MTKYETTFILEPGLDDARVNDEVNKVTQWIKDLGGEVVDVQRWGKRRLAYEIRKKRDGIYTMVFHEGAGDAVKELERRLRLNESVLRVLTVVHAPASLLAAQTDEAAAAAAAAGVEADELGIERTWLKNAKARDSIRSTASSASRKSGTWTTRTRSASGGSSPIAARSFRAACRARAPVTRSRSPRR